MMMMLSSYYRTALMVCLAIFLMASLALGQTPVTSNAGVGAPTVSTPSEPSSSPETSVAQFTPGATTPRTTTSPIASGLDTASLASHSSQGIASGDSPSSTTTGNGIVGISTGPTGGYNTPAQTATTADPAAGTQGGNSGVLQGGQNGAGQLKVSGMVVVSMVLGAVVLLMSS
ncbi:unnamed protein product [Sympodiomycopsis kandeliae]